jgi:NAD(P)-dependent dehydrogenase (short-subunit alcohol dehydrogenase family)
MTEDGAEVGAGVADVDLNGTRVLVTGATDGIGRETALALGRLGATVHVHGRSREKGEAVLEALASTAGGPGRLHIADFASLSAVEELANQINDYGTDGDHGLDVLVNNAGGLFSEPRITEDGVEYTFQVNHLAPFLLTNRLAPALRTAGGRVVTVSSAAHRSGSMDFTSLRTVDGYSAFRAYCRSKLANVLFTRELARRYRAGPANCLHPGAVPGSSFFRDAEGVAGLAARVAGKLPSAVTDAAFTSVVEAAETPVYLAAAPEVASVTGEYFVNCESAEPAVGGRDDRTARRLWAVSADLSGLDPGETIGGSAPAGRVGGPGR